MGNVYENNVVNSYDHADKLSRGYSYTIDYNGLWYYHDGDNPGHFSNSKVAKLFAGAASGQWANRGLKIDENGECWLSTPFEKYKIDVEDVPFVIQRFDVRDKGTEQEIDLFTNFDECVMLGPDHGLEIMQEPKGGVDVMYVDVRSGLKARFGRAVNDDIVNNYLDQQQNGEQMDYLLRSRGVSFPVATLDI